MITTFSSPEAWAQNEFEFAQLGDPRRTKRLVKIATKLAANPGGTLPAAFPDWAELKAAYRFMGQRGVSYESVIAPHCQRTLEACRQPGEYLLLEDTSETDYSKHPVAQELGYIGNGKG